MFAKSLTTAALGALLFAAPGANAAVTVVVGPNPGESSAVFTPGLAGETATIDFNGLVNGSEVAGLTARLGLTLLGVTPSFDGLSTFYSFGYTLSNTSGAPITNSRISLFGFSTDPNRMGANIVSGPFTNIGAGQLPGSNVLEFCLQSQNATCSGGGGGGVSLGNPPFIGSFDLQFAGTVNSLTLSDFSVRYQSIDAPSLGLRGDSGIGKPIMSGVVPEPATWAMMILGFGLIGGALRSRKAQVARVTYA